MNDIIVRNYEENDYEDVYMLLKDGYESSVEKKVLEAQYIGSNKNIIVAEDTINSSVVGCIFWEVKEDYIRPCKTMYLSYLIVSSDFRRQGIAHLLYKNIETICIDRGCSSIEFTSANFRKNAHILYKSMGYTIKDTSIFIKEF